MAVLDGNALAGALAEVLGADGTRARLRCRGCGAVDVAARAAVTVTAMGAIARCRTCGAVLLTVVDDGERRWVGLPGASAIGVAGP